MEVKLTKAIIVDGESVDKLIIKEPTFKHLIEMSKPVPERDPNNTKEVLWRPRSESEQALALIASLANITEREAGTLSIQDVAQVMEVVAPFLELSQVKM